MNAFRPFFKETCEGNECVMWKNERCLIASFLQTTSNSVLPSEEIVSASGIEFQRVEEEAPEWLRTRAAEELAVEILEFKKKQFLDIEYLRSYDVSSLFWETKGVEHTYHMPPDTRLKINKANALVQALIRKEEETQRKEQIEREREELFSLISHCVDWDRTHGLNRVTLADIDAYILERSLDIPEEHCM